MTLLADSHAAVILIAGGGWSISYAVARTAPQQRKAASVARPSSNAASASRRPGFVLLSAMSSTCSSTMTKSEAPITISALRSRNPDPSTARAHWLSGDPPSGFQNPWPSYKHVTLTAAFSARFGNHPEKNFVPVPQGPGGVRSDELVRVRKPNWGRSQPDRLRATWLGHAGFLVETPSLSSSTNKTRDAQSEAHRGIRVLFDPVFSERTSPFTFLGPKRYTPTPCALGDLPDVDIVCISHNHYDHLDYATVKELYARRQGKLHFFVGRNGAAWFHHNICTPAEVTELDWWEAVEVRVAGVGRVRLTCTPAQHGSKRSVNDTSHALWCSWVMETIGSNEDDIGDASPSPSQSRKLFFAGDTGYQSASAPSPCPAFAQIGSVFGPFDLALLPIGLFMPTSFMGHVHCSPDQALRIHTDIKARISVGMHYGTFRGGISGQYEDVRVPPRRWREAAEREGMWLGGGVEGTEGKAIDVSRAGVGLCDVGETVAV